MNFYIRDEFIWVPVMNLYKYSDDADWPQKAIMSKKMSTSFSFFLSFFIYLFYFILFLSAYVFIALKGHSF